jgi:diguanylate cyclase
MIGLPSRRNGIALAVGLILCIGAFAAWIDLQWGGAAVTRDVDVLGILAANLLATIACAATAWRHRGRRRIAWALMAGSALSWTLGEAVWAVYQVVLSTSVPAPGFPDLGYLGAVPLAIASILMFAARRPPIDLRTLLDGAIVAASLFFISWTTALGEVYRTSTGTLLQSGVSLAYPATDILMATMATILAVRAGVALRVPLLLVAAGLLANALADSAFAYLSALGHYSDVANLSDTGYWAGYLLIALAGFKAFRTPAAEAQKDELTPSRLRDWHPYLTVTIVAGVAFGRDLGGGLDHLAVGLLILVGLLVLVRQFLTLIENHRLTVALHGLTQELRADVEARRRAETALAYQATHDALTDLPNRILLRDRLGQAIRIAIRSKEPVALLMIDLDRFKEVNDRLGHDVGDELLRACAHRLQSALRASDTMARLGGDEFAVVLPTAGVEGARRVALKLLARLEEPFILAGEDLTIGMSIGIAVFPDHGDTLEALMRRADVAMYIGKRAGGRTAVAA